jgi:ubiquinone/menaquinone biosynthesis C-methylase UbiE
MKTAQALAALRRDWTALGTADPLWAVCVDPDKRAGRWDIAEFLASGQAEVTDALAELDRLGCCYGRQSALDFGCGVGRLTAALSDHFAAVTGVDIAEPMLAYAKSLQADHPHCRFLLNDRPDLSIFPDDSFDLVYSSLVLQHLPPRLAESYLAEFVRVARPGGAIVIVVPEANLRTPGGLVYAHAPQPLIRWLQRRVFGFPAPMYMHTVPAERVRAVVESSGARLLASISRGRSGHWWMSALYIGI